MVTEKTIRIEYIAQKNKSLGKQITNLKDYLAGLNPDHYIVQSRLENLMTLYQTYGKYNDELEMIQADHPLVKNFDEVEDAYYATVAAAQRAKSAADANDPMAHSTANTSLNTTVTFRQDLPRLPQIKLLMFDGDMKQWPDFKNRFGTLVHERTDIGEGVKASQLFAHLTGKALAKLIILILAKRITRLHGTRF